MSTADEAIARVRKIDYLTREASIIKNLVKQIAAGQGRLGVMDRFGQHHERNFSEFPSTSTERFIQIANKRIEEIHEEIETVRDEFGKQDTEPLPTRVAWLFGRRAVRDDG